MSEEEPKSQEFEFMILTKEAKLSLLYQMMQDLETDIYGYTIQEPMEEDPNYLEWEYNLKSAKKELLRLRKLFEELGGNYNFNKVSN
mgnify:FL=1|tara:strand:+ start:78 stop:338 length:261 start_codon:yes stop_codon:yes gene_type:complete